MNFGNYESHQLITEQKFPKQQYIKLRQNVGGEALDISAHSLEQLCHAHLARPPARLAHQ